MSKNTVFLYKKAYEREKRARQQAEEILEDKTYELYSINQQLQRTNDLLRTQQKNLVKTEKLVALGQLSAGVAHEINNPLAFVISNFNSLKKHFLVYQKTVEHINSTIAKHPDIEAFYHDNELDFIQTDSQQIFEEISEGLDRVKDIIGNLKSFARTAPSDRERAGISDILQTALKLSQNETKYRCQIEITIDKNIPDIQCNKNELVQVFINLIVNAAQAIKSQGTIEIKAYSNEDYVVVDITDNGCGITEEHMNRIFDPFFTSKPIGEGTGLGLSVSYGIVQEMDGTISVESNPGKGSTFTVLLPCNTEEISQLYQQ